MAVLEAKEEMVRVFHVYCELDDGPDVAMSAEQIPRRGQPLWDGRPDVTCYSHYARPINSGDKRRHWRVEARAKEE